MIASRRDQFCGGFAMIALLFLAAKGAAVEARQPRGLLDGVLASARAVCR
jgi:hypothetical protein